MSGFRVCAKRLEVEIEAALLNLQLGLPARCRCDIAEEGRSLEYAATVCARCGGLVETDEEQANRSTGE